MDTAGDLVPAGRRTVGHVVERESHIAEILRERRSIIGKARKDEAAMVRYAARASERMVRTARPDRVRIAARMGHARERAVEVEGPQP